MTKARQLADLGNAYDDGALSNRNLIINGAMQVAQRGTSTSGTTGNGYFATDRWDKGNVSLGTWTVSQETDAPDGFSNSMKYLCTTADASPASSGYLTFRQRIESQNTQHLKFGTSDAVNMTCSFWVKSNVTGTYTLALEHDRGGGENGKTYTINDADTWEYKTLTYSGQTTTAIPNDNAVGLELQFWLSTGSTYNGGTFTEDTYTTTTANRVSPNQANLASATSNYWQITGVQLEVGDTATPFEHRSYGEELAKCQRYFYRHGDFYDRKTIAQSFRTSSSNVEGVVTFPNTMRAVPTFIATSGTNYYRDYCLNSGTNLTTVTAHNIYVNNAVLQWTGHPRSAGQAGYMRANNAGATVDFDAEL